MFKNKTLLITGGTGSFGQKMLKFFINNTDIEKFIIEYLKNNEYITNKVLQDVCNIKDTKSKTILRNLVSREIILLEGANKNRRYKLNKKK